MKKSELRKMIREELQLYKEELDWGLRWIEFNKSDRQVTKQKDFASEKKRIDFIKKLEQKDNFKSIESYSDPTNENVVNESLIIQANNDILIATLKYKEVVREEKPEALNEWEKKRRIINKLVGDFTKKWKI